MIHTHIYESQATGESSTGQGQLRQLEVSHDTLLSRSDVDSFLPCGSVCFLADIGSSWQRLHGSERVLSF